MKNTFSRIFLLVLLCGTFNRATAQSIISVSPDTIGCGFSYPLTITGQGTGFTPPSQGSPGIGSAWLTRGMDTLNGYDEVVLSPTVLMCGIATQSNTAVGFWDLHVMAASGELVLPDGVFIDCVTNNDPAALGIRNSIRLSPNPVTDHFTFSYQLGSKANVEILITDLTGRFLMRLEKGVKAPGMHESRHDLPAFPLRQAAVLVVLRVDDMAFATKVALAR